MRKMIVQPMSGLSTDYFTVKIYENDECVYSTDFMYGRNVCYDRQSATEKTPYAGTALYQIVRNFHVDEFWFAKGKYVFSGRIMTVSDVLKWMWDYIKDNITLIAKYRGVIEEEVPIQKTIRIHSPPPVF